MLPPRSLLLSVATALGLALATAGCGLQRGGLGEDPVALGDTSVDTWSGDALEEVSLDGTLPDTSVADTSSPDSPTADTVAIDSEIPEVVADVDPGDTLPVDSGRDSAIADTLVASDTGPTETTCTTVLSESPRSCSGGGTAKLTVTFLNKCSARTVELFWVPYAPCPKETSYGTIPPGWSMAMITYVGNNWRIRDAATKALLKDVPSLTASTTTVAVP